MSVLKAVIDIIAALRSERVPLAARLDAIDLSIDNLSRVYGLHGTPQPLPLAPVGVKRRGGKTAGAPEGEAEQRRAHILTVISRSEMGLSLAELRKQTPQMDGRARSNALQVLKTLGKIRRVGNTWRKAA